MPTYKGRWKAKVEHDFEIHAEDEDDFQEQIEREMNPRSVVELHDFEYEVTTIDDDE